MTNAIVRGDLISPVVKSFLSTFTRSSYFIPFLSAHSLYKPLFFFSITSIANLSIPSISISFSLQVPLISPPFYSLIFIYPISPQSPINSPRCHLLSTRHLKFEHHHHLNFTLFLHKFIVFPINLYPLPLHHIS